MRLSIFMQMIQLFIVELVFKQQQAFDSIQSQSQSAQTGFKCRKKQTHVVLKRKRVPAVFPSLVSAPGISIETVASYKYLGVVIDVNLFLKPQIDYL